MSKQTLRRPWDGIISEDDPKAYNAAAPSARDWATAGTHDHRRAVPHRRHRIDVLGGNRNGVCDRVRRCGIVDGETDRAAPAIPQHMLADTVPHVIDGSETGASTTGKHGVRAPGTMSVPPRYDLIQILRVGRTAWFFTWATADSIQVDGFRQAIADSSCQNSGPQDARRSAVPEPQRYERAPL